MQNSFVNNIFLTSVSCCLLLLLVVGCRPRNERRINDTFSVLPSPHSLTVLHQGRKIAEIATTGNMYFVSALADGIPSGVIAMDKWKREPIRVTGIVLDEDGQPKALELELEP